MIDLDRLREILDTLRHNRVRTLLTAFGVFWGIFMLMLLLGSGTGLENGVSREYSGMATNSFVCWSQRTSKPYRGLPAGRRFELDTGDVAAVKANIPDADVVAPRLQLGGFGGSNQVDRGRRSGAFSVMGDVAEIRAVEPLAILRGRFLNPLDVDQRRKVAVIGDRVREVLFATDENPIGQHIRINGVFFRVIGVFGSLDGGERGDRATQTIYVPFPTAQRAFNFGNTIGWLAVTTRGGVPASEVEATTLALLRGRHSVAPDDDRALGSWNTEEEFLKIQGLFTGIRALVWIVGIGTLTAGVIGVSNIMLVIVNERTKEIGIRRAVGATPFDILSQIVLEAVLLTSAAGYLGLIAGVSLIDAVRGALAAGGGQSEMFLNPNVTLASAGQALTILIISGALAGLLPAHRALRIRTTDALRAD